MAARSIGSLTITVGLVAIPAKLYTATSEDRVRFNRLHKGCGGRLGQEQKCKACSKLVSGDDVEQGFEVAPDTFVKFSAEELAAIDAERPDTLELVAFVPSLTIDLLHVEKTQYLGPDKGGDRAYALLSRALEQAGAVGVGQWRTRGRDTLVVVRPYQDGLVLHTLWYATEIRAFEDVPRATGIAVHASELELAARLIAQLARPRLEIERFTDGYAARIKAAADAKVAGEQLVAAPAGPRTNVIDLFEALTRSVARNAPSEAPSSAAGPKKARPKAAPKSRAPRARRAATG